MVVSVPSGVFPCFGKISTLSCLALVVLCSGTMNMNVPLLCHAMIQARSKSRALLSSSSCRFSRSSFHGGGDLLRGSMRMGLRFRERSLSSMYSSSAAASTPRSNNKVHDDNDARSFLGEIETTVARVLAQHGSANLQDLALTERESVGVARHLDQRLGNLQRNNDCRTCWLQRAHCICQSCPAVHNDGTNNATPNRVARLRRLFLVYHHKEICLAVDTAKLLASTLPVSLDASASQVRVVVGGIPAEFQDSMKELEEAVVAGSCLVLFPDETARTWKEFQQERHIIMNDDDPQNNNNLHYNETTDYDVIVLDGTWEQARKLYRRYVPDEASGGPYRIQLETEALERIISGESGADGGDENPNASGGTGRQLRRHPVLWREIGTTAATASLLQDMDPDGPWERILATYQQRADAAARAQLGAPRMRLREQKRERS